MIYLAYTSPNLAYAIGVVSQFMHDLTMRQMQVVDHILLYLKASSGRGLLLNMGDNLSMETYANYDHASSITDKRSTFGYCIFFKEPCNMEK